MRDSGFGRLLGVLVSPVETFRSIAARPTWLPAILVLFLCSAGLGLLITPRIDFEDMIKQQVQKSGREMSQEQLDRGIELAKRMSSPPVVAAQGLLLPIGVCLLTLFPWAVFRLLGSELTYGQALSVFLHALMTQMVSVLLSIPVVLSRSSLGYMDIKRGILKSNLAALLADADTRPAIAALLSSLDFFSLWCLVLLILGYREAARVSTAKAATTMIILWALLVAVKVGWASVFG